MNKMWSPYILLVLLPTPILGQSNYQNNTPIVDLGYAKYTGSYNATSGMNSWFGLRYAQAPVGELRWQAPMEIESKNDYNPTRTMDASKPGPSCMQGYPAAFTSPPGLTSTEDEDCLLVDVIAPAKPVSSNLPVMVQIHGGGYTFGTGQSQAPGNALVYQSNGNLIYVTIQYRLGAYGFLGGSEVLANGVANAGVLDQRAALMWVQRYISKFGGDPSKVTIIGASAGGGSVISQMIMYGGATNPPFRTAIAEYPWMQPYRNSSTLEKQFDTLCQASGCNDLTCLRQLSPTDLRSAADKTYLKAYQNGDYGYGDFFFGPYVDGSVIRDLPSNEFKLGHFTKVPLLTNREGYEGHAFTNKTQTSEAEMVQDLQKLYPYAKQSFFTRLFQLYPRADYNSTFSQRSAIFGDLTITCPSSYIAAAASDHGMPVWKMIFYAGTMVHGALVPFLETASLQGDSNNATLASILRSYYISFAASLDPNAVNFTSIDHPVWPQYQNPGVAGFNVLNITDTTIRPSDDLDVRPQCDFFHSRSEVVRN